MLFAINYFMSLLYVVDGDGHEAEGQQAGISA